MTDNCPLHSRDLPCPICANPFYSHVWDLVFKKNRNVLILVEGYPGTGKSWWGLRVGSELDPGFNSDTLEDRVIFKVNKFLEVLKEADPEAIIPKITLYKGAVLVLEEFGVMADHRKWFTVYNEIVNYVFQTFRYMNLIVIINVPIADYIDSDTRKLFKFHVETLSVDLDKEMVVTKIKEQIYNTTTRKIYRKFLRYRIDGEWIKFRLWKFKKPPTKIWHKYEEMHKPFKRELRDKLAKKIALVERSSDSEEKRQLFNEEEAIQHVLKNQDYFFHTRRKKRICDQQLVESYFKVGRFIGLRVKRGAEAQAEGGNNAPERKR